RAHNDEDSQFPERMCVGLEGRRGSRRRGLRIVGRRQRSKPSLFSTGCQRLRLCCGDCQVNVPLLYDFDGLLPGDLGHLLPRIAIATQGAASAKAESSKNLFTAKAIVAPTKFGEAQATAQWLFIPHDPQGRAQVTLDLKLNMAATQASPDSIDAQHAGAFSYAGYSVLVCGIGS